MNSDRYKIGVDPGLTGAIAVLCNNDLVDILDMPSIAATKGKGNIVSPQLLTANVEKILKSIDDNCVVSCNIEQVSAMPGQGVASTFKFGRSLGVAEGVIAAAKIPITYVTPQKWKKQQGLIRRDKDSSRQLCLQMFPNKVHYFKRKKDNGRSDAVLIAMYSPF